MSELSDKQKEFSRKIAVLKLVAFELGYELTEGDYYRDPRCPYGHPKSCHKLRLAADLNLFDAKTDKYLIDGSGHDVLHNIWDLMGGAKRIKHDLNHYSMEHQGMR